VSAPRGPAGGDHEVFDELAVGWALHALEPEDEATFARHLPDCARCARTVAETHDVMAAMAQDLPPAEPSEELRDRLRAAVEETEQLSRPAPPERPAARPAERPAPEPASRPAPRPAAGPAAGPAPRPVRPTSPAPQRWPPPDPGRGRPSRTGTPGWRRRLPVALAAAAVAAIVALVTWNVSLEAARQREQATAAAENQIVQSLMSPGQATIAPVSNSDGHSVATVVARQGQAQVVTWGLSENDRTASTYVLWGMQNGTPVALGTFDVVSRDMDLRTVGSDRTGLDSYTAYGISLEPGRTPPPSPSRIVATGQVSS
jgi:anti-sigma-K factor RskA